MADFWEGYISILPVPFLLSMLFRYIMYNGIVDEIQKRVLLLFIYYVV